MSVTDSIPSKTWRKQVQSVPVQDRLEIAAGLAKQEALDLGRLPATTLGCFSRDGTVRQTALLILRHKWFDNFSLFAILLNFCVLASYDPMDKNSMRNVVLNSTELPFNIVFTFELLIKLIAYGVYGPGSYLSDRWNWLDGIIVLMGYVQFLPDVGNLSALRTIRVLRTLSRYPALRLIVERLASSIPALANVLLLIVFTLVVFGIIGLQVWAGLLRGQCGYADPDAGGAWTLNPMGVACALSCETQPYFGSGVECTRAWGDACPDYSLLRTDAATGQTYVTVVPQSCREGRGPGYGVYGFDNLGQALLTLSVSVSLEGWTKFMYDLQAAWGYKWIVALYFIALTSLISYFMLELLLAVVWSNFQSGQDDQLAKANQIFYANEAEARKALHLLHKRKKLSRGSIVVSQVRTLFARMGSVASVGPLPVSSPRAKSPSPIPALTPPLSGETGKAAGQPLVIKSIKEDTLPEAGPMSPQSMREAAGGSVGATPAAQTLTHTSETRPIPVPVFPRLQALTDSTLFNNAMSVVIFANFVQLALPYNGMLPVYSAGLEYSYYCFTAIFALEMILKIIAAWVQLPALTQAETQMTCWSRTRRRGCGGPWPYFANPFDAFDFILVVLSFLDIALTQLSGDGTGSIAALRSLRLARVIKLVRVWKELRVTLNVMGSALAKVRHAVIVLLLVLFVFALLGMQLFGNAHRQAWMEGRLNELPRANFEDLPHALLAAFQTFTGEDFDSLVAEAWVASGGAGIAFFFSLFLIGKFMVLNLFLAILLESFESGIQRLKEEEAAKAAEAVRAATRSVWDSKNTVKSTATGEGKDRSVTSGRSLGTAATFSSTSAGGASVVIGKATSLSSVASSSGTRPSPDKDKDKAGGGIAAVAGDSVYRPGRPSIVALAEGVPHSYSDSVLAVVDGGDDEEMGGGTAQRSRRGSYLEQDLDSQLAELSRSSAPVRSPRHMNGENVNGETRATSLRRAIARRKDSVVAAAVEDRDRRRSQSATPRQQATSPMPLSPALSSASGRQRDPSPLPASPGVYPAPTRPGMGGPHRSYGSGGTDHSPALTSALTPGPMTGPPRLDTSSRIQVATGLREGATKDRIDLEQGSLAGGGDASPASTLPSPSVLIDDSVRAEVSVNRAGRISQIKTMLVQPDGRKVELRLGRAGDITVSLRASSKPDLYDPDREDTDVMAENKSASSDQDLCSAMCPPPAVTCWTRLSQALTPRPAVRLPLVRIVRNVWFDRFVLLIILISSINLAIDEPRLEKCKDIPVHDPASCLPLTTWLYWSDRVITALFVGEMVLKIGALGLWHGKYAYMSSNWNRLDGSIVIISILSLALDGVPGLKAIRSLRALRSLRPLRVVRRVPGLKLVVNSILSSFKKVRTVLLVNFLFMCVISIIGLQTFMGSMSVCNDPSVSDQAQCTGMFMLTGELCTLLPSEVQEQACRATNGTAFQRLWEPIPMNFDNFPSALLSVFELSTQEGWPDSMAYGIDAVGQGQGLRRDHNIAAACFYVMIQVACGMFLLDLFTGVIVANYEELKHVSQGGGLLTPEQQLWVEQTKLLVTSMPTRGLKRPTGGPKWFRKLRLRAFRVASSRAFEWGMMFIIVLNTSVLAVDHYGVAPTWETVGTSINTACAVLFAAEAAVKLFGFGRQYFRFNWNRFDFVLVITSFIGQFTAIGPVGTLFRILRVVRIFRLVRTSRSLMTIFRTLIVSLPSLMNVGTVFLLLLYMFSVVGMSLFAGIRHGSPVHASTNGLSNDANFDTFFTGMLTLYRGTTGESWYAVMFDSMVSAPYCIPEGPDANCGDSWGPPIFWCAYIVLSAFILLKMLIAVLIDNLQDALKSEEAVDSFSLNVEWLKHFEEAWSNPGTDPDGTGFCDHHGLLKLVTMLPYPLGLKDTPGVRHSMTTRKAALDLLMELDLVPVAHRGKLQYQYNTVLHALSTRATALARVSMPLLSPLSSGTDEEQARRRAAHSVIVAAQMRVKTLGESRRIQPGGATGQAKEFTLAEQLAASRVQAAYRGLRARRAKNAQNGKKTLTSATSFLHKMAIKAATTLSVTARKIALANSSGGGTGLLERQNTPVKSAFRQPSARDLSRTGSSNGRPPRHAEQTPQPALVAPPNEAEVPRSGAAGPVSTASGSITGTSTGGEEAGDIVVGPYLYPGREKTEGKEETSSEMSSRASSIGASGRSGP